MCLCVIISQKQQLTNCLVTLYVLKVFYVVLQDKITNIFQWRIQKHSIGGGGGGGGYIRVRQPPVSSNRTLVVKFRVTFGYIEKNTCIC